MKNLKKIIAVALSLIMAGAMFILPASAGTCSCSNDPIVYVKGKQDIYLCDDDGVPYTDENGEYIKSTEFNLDISAMTSEILPLFAKAFLTDSDADCDALSTALVNDIMPLYKDKGVNGDGEIIDPVHYRMTRECKLGYYAGETHGYHMGYNNDFYFDYRLPLSQSAAQLQAFVDTVKARTGHDKVVIVTRCGGANLVEAWLALYQEEKNFSDVSTLIIMSSTGDGLHSVEDLFSGNLNINVDGAYRLLGNFEFSDYIGDEWGEIAELVLDALRETYGINLTLEMVDKVYDKIKDSVISPVLREYYGSCGLMLSFLKDNFYESIDFIYPTQELKDEYAVVINDATLIHEKAISRAEEILKNAEDAGIYVGLVCEYGYQPVPLSEDGNLVGDDTSTVKDQSYGATTATVEGKLSDEYIAEREEAGYGKYISADKQIDASTGLFPETTWYIKNIDHDWPESVHVLCVAMIRQHITVSSGAYNQFLVFHETTENDYGRLDTLQEVNDNDFQWKTNISDAEEGEATTTLIEKIVAWFEKLASIIKNMIEQIITITGGN